jgi:hypothetical protein
MFKLFLIILLNLSSHLTQKTKVDAYQLRKANLAIEMVSQFIPAQTCLRKLSLQETLFEGTTYTASAFCFARSYLDLKSAKKSSNLDDLIATAYAASESVKSCKRLAATQSAMNTLLPSHRFIDVETETYKLQKMKALLAFEYLTVVKQAFSIDELEEGLYVTTDSVFIKEDMLSFYFDNHVGCVAFFPEDDPLELVELHKVDCFYKILPL